MTRNYTMGKVTVISIVKLARKKNTIAYWGRQQTFWDIQQVFCSRQVADR